ncbi:unnamed protein product [Ascophyllum nodosum]
MYKPHELGDRDALVAYIARLSGSTKRQAEMVMNRAITPGSSATLGPDHHTEALSALLSPPSAANIPSLRGAPRSQTQTHARSPSASSPRTFGEGVREDAAPGKGSAVTFRMFLARLMRPESKGLVRAIRMFLFSIIGNGGDASPVSARSLAAAGEAIPPDLEDVEIYGSSFLVPRCAEFFLAMQNAIGVHPSWAELGYDSIVSCREHLERFVMTKIHPLAFGRMLNGAVDGSISARLRALQFLNYDDLGIVSHARNHTVLALAQEELRKMGAGRCPGDIVSRVVRCCDIIFALLDQGRRDEPKAEERTGSEWRPDLDPVSTADEFLPVLIYAVLRANVPRLHSMSEYVQAFHSPVALMSRPGYCFVALRSAVEFLMTLTGAQVGMSEKEFRRRALETMRGRSSAPATR